MRVSTQPSPDDPFGGLKGPHTVLDPALFNRILLVVDTDHLEGLASDLASVACMVRCGEVARGQSPDVRVIARESLTGDPARLQDLVGLSGIDGGREQPLEQPSQGHALVLFSTPVHEREFAAFIGRLAMLGLSYETFPDLLQDGVPLGNAPRRSRSIAALLHPTVAQYGDGHVRELQSIFVDRREDDQADRARRMVRDTLALLKIELNLAWPKEDKESQEKIALLVSMVIDWAAGAVVPSVVEEQAEEYERCCEIAISGWQAAEEIRPGVFRINGVPPDEHDNRVRLLMSELYGADASAGCVLEWHRDYRINSIREFQSSKIRSRWKEGEDPSVLLNEALSILDPRREALLKAECEALWKAGAFPPGRILEKLLREAEYKPDPKGIFRVLKFPGGHFGLTEALAKAQVGVLRHKSFFSGSGSGILVPIVAWIRASDADRLLKAAGL